jgi:hypothetical protein
MEGEALFLSLLISWGAAVIIAVGICWGAGTIANAIEGKREPEPREKDVGEWPRGIVGPDESDMVDD